MEPLRSLTIARNSAVNATTTASNQIKAILVGADHQLRMDLNVKASCNSRRSPQTSTPSTASAPLCAASAAAGCIYTKRSSSST